MRSNRSPMVRQALDETPVHRVHSPLCSSRGRSRTIGHDEEQIARLHDPTQGLARAGKQFELLRSLR